MASGDRKISEMTDISGLTRDDLLVLARTVDSLNYKVSVGVLQDFILDEANVARTDAANVFTQPNTFNAQVAAETATNPVLELVSGDTDGPVLQTRRTGAAVSNHVVGSIDLQHNNADSTPVTYTRIRAAADNVAAGTEEGRFDIWTVRGGALSRDYRVGGTWGHRFSYASVEVARIVSTGVAVNPAGVSGNAAAALDLQGGGGMLVGPATGGDQGTGNINISGAIFINGVQVLPAP